MRTGIATSAASALCALLLPKCPICIAGWLSIVGLSAGVGAMVAPVVRPAAIILAIATALVIVAGHIRTASRAAVRDPPAGMVARLGLRRHRSRHCRRTYCATVDDAE